MPLHKLWSSDEGQDIAFPSKRKRGNPDWGKPVPVPALITEFELQVRLLGLTKEQYADSTELRLWCGRNRNRVYVPEWLLKKWGMTVEPFFNWAA